MAAARTHRDEVAAALTDARRKAAKSVAAGVRERLARLAMEAADFTIEVQPAAPGPTGADTVEFMLAANPGHLRRRCARWPAAASSRACCWR